jgi:hypothetical protein
VERLKKRVQAGEKLEGQEMETAEEAVADEKVTVAALQSMRDTQSKKVQDLDFFMMEYEQKATEVKALEGACLELEAKVAVEEAAAKAGI